MNPTSATGGDAPSQRTALIRRYALILGLAYGVLVAAAVGFFVYQTDEREKAEWRTIAGRVQEHALILDALAGAVGNRVKELQADAARGMAADRLGPADAGVTVDADGRLDIGSAGRATRPAHRRHRRSGRRGGAGGRRGRAS